MTYKYLFVERRSYEAMYEEPSDHYEEFVQEARVALCAARDDDEDEAEGKRVELMSAEVLIVRGLRSDDGVDVLDMADAHSAEAEQVAAYLNAQKGHEFYARFDVIPEYANTLLIDDVSCADKPTTEEIRQFVRRVSDQFDVDLVFVRQEDESLARHFRGFFKTDGPFLICSKAHRWPGSEGEPVITADGGRA